MADDFYKILGVDKGAAAAEIKKAYRALAKKYHPDINPDNKHAEDKFKEVTEAYAVLSDPKKRQQYDAFGGKENFESGFDFGEFFQGFQGGGGQGQSSFRFGGGGQGFQFDMSGLEDIFGTFSQGGGFSHAQRRGHPGHQAQKQVPTFSLEVDFLVAARGGEIEVDIQGARKRIKVPAGIMSGQKMRITQPETYIQVHVQPSHEFKRQGNDVHGFVSISPIQAMLGGSVLVKTIDGESEVNLPEGTSSHAKLRLKGKGINKGDHFVEIKIVPPENLSEETKEILKKISE